MYSCPIRRLSAGFIASSFESAPDTFVYGLLEGISVLGMGSRCSVWSARMIAKSLPLLLMGRDLRESSYSMTSRSNIVGVSSSGAARSRPVAWFPEPRKRARRTLHRRPPHQKEQCTDEHNGQPLVAQSCFVPQWPDREGVSQSQQH